MILGLVSGHDFSRAVNGAKQMGFTGCGKTPNVWRKDEICGMENNQSSLTDRSWGILARSIFYPFREIGFFRSLFSPCVLLFESLLGIEFLHELQTQDTT